MNTNPGNMSDAQFTDTLRLMEAEGYIIIGKQGQVIATAKGKAYFAKNNTPAMNKAADDLAAYNQRGNN